MNTTAAATCIPLRDDVQALVDRHLVGVDRDALSEPQRWERYRSFRTALHDVVGCGADSDKIDHRMFIMGIQEFCRGINF